MYALRVCLVLLLKLAPASSESKGFNFSTTTLKKIAFLWYKFKSNLDPAFAAY